MYCHLAGPGAVSLILAMPAIENLYQYATLSQLCPPENDSLDM